MKLYLCGPMNGLPQRNFPAFREAKHALEGSGNKVVSPVEMDDDEGHGEDALAEPGTPDYCERLARDCAAICDPTLDGVAVLAGWQTSHGASAEVGLARAIGVPVYYAETLEELPEPHPGSLAFHGVLAALGRLHDRKQEDYGRDNDPFANVRGATEWGIPAWVGAMVRATDKVRRLQTFARKGTLANEGVIDAFDDLAVYAIIARVLYEESVSPR